MEQLAQVGGQLGIDNSFFWLFGLMWVLYALLSGVYLKPFQKLLHYRKAKTEGTKKEAAELTAQAEQAVDQYKIRLKEVTDVARQEVRESEAAARREEAEIVNAASTKSKASVQTAQKELEAQRKSAVDALSAEISGIASEIATKVLGRPVGTR